MSEPTDGAARLRARLANARRVHIDAPVLACHLLGTERYLELTRLLFACLDAGETTGQTSAISLYQILAEPYRRAQPQLAETALKGLASCTDLEIVPVTSEIAAQAANARAQLGGRVERAIQISTAVDRGADLYLTLGSTLRRIAGVQVEDLDDYAG